MHHRAKDWLFICNANITERDSRVSPQYSPGKVLKGPGNGGGS